MPGMRDAVVIGAGPAGIAAAIYLRRAGADSVLLEKGEVGGLLRSANLVENYPGFPEGVSGKRLVSLFKGQMRSVGLSPVKALVLSVRRTRGAFRTESDSGSFLSKSVLVGTGTVPKRIALKGASGAASKRVFYDVNEAIEASRRRERILILGGGDAAFDYALNLRARGRDIAIISRSRPRCLRLLAERAMKEKIAVAVGCEPLELRTRRDGMEILCRSGKRIRTFEGDAVLVAAGRIPDMGVLGGLSKKVKVRGHGPETNIPGLYMIGDILGASYRQTGIAVGSGIMAAMMVQDSLCGPEVRR